MVQAGQCPILDLLDTMVQFQPATDWVSWRAFLAALFGLPMSASERALYARCAARTDSPAHQAREGWVIVGRRGGKGRVGSLVAATLAVFRDYTPYLAAGQRALLPVIAADRRQAQEVMGYLRGLFAHPFLAWAVEDALASEIRLKTRVDIAVYAASYRSVRAPTLIGAVLDEVAFWRTDDGSRNPDDEILTALRPGLATIPGSLLLALSSPYARRGVLWDTREQHYGRDGDDILVWCADTLTMHPGSAQLQAEVARAYADDPSRATAEYGGEFRSDLETFISLEVVRACTMARVTVIPPEFKEPRADGTTPTLREYFAFVDVSGGSSESYTLAISHWDHGTKTATLDFARCWRAPFVPSEVTAQAAADVKRYGIKYVTGDHYGGEWPRERWQEQGLTYIVSDRSKHDIYKAVLPALNSKHVRLLDDPQLYRELTSLERRVTPTGQERIDHPAGGMDDLANAAAGALLLAYERRPPADETEDMPHSTAELVRRQRAEWWDKDKQTSGPQMRRLMYARRSWRK